MRGEECSTKDLNELLEEFSFQLDRMAGQVFRVEETLSELLSEGGTRNHTTITKLQSLDYIRQSLEDLALLASLLKNQPFDVKVDVSAMVSKLKLQETIRLLNINNPRDRSSSNFGEIDLF